MFFELMYLDEEPMFWVAKIYYKKEYFYIHYMCTLSLPFWLTVFYAMMLTSLHVFSWN